MAAAGMKLIQVGKVKEVYSVEGSDELEFRFTDKISVFDKVIPSLIPRKGESLCRTSAFWFERIKGIGINSHYIRMTGPSSMRVRKVKVERDLSKIDKGSRSILIPLEVIARYYVAGSLLDRIKKGKVKPEALGYPSGHVPKLGEPLPHPLLEATTKLEEIDSPLSNAEAMELARLDRKEWDELLETVLKVDDLIGKQASARGLIHVDGKKEFGFDEERRLMLLDTFGTADEDRFWEKKTYEESGKMVELSKEHVRQYYRTTGYHETLMKARDEGATKQTEPPIPALPDNEVKKVASLYAEMFERLTGERF
jgi:phosphoribosylaminoimidazole-succinocarboxamide synthase